MTEDGADNTFPAGCHHVQAAKKAIESGDVLTLGYIVYVTLPMDVLEILGPYLHHDAVKKKRYALLKFLLKQPTCWVNEPDEKGSTCLILACDTEVPDIAIILLLLSFNADVNALDKEGQSSLYISCKRQNYDLANLLLKNGARANFQMCPLHIAVELQSSAIFSLLLSKRPCCVNFQDYRGLTCLMIICQSEPANTDRLHNILRYNPDVNIADARGETALHYACRKGSLLMVIVLLQMGANINAVNRNRQTPLSFAIFGNHEKVIEYLLANAADANLLDEGSRKSIWKKLIPYATKCNLRDRKGFNLITYAIFRNDINVLKTVLKNGVTITPKNIYEVTELRRLPMLKLLWGKVNAKLVSEEEIFTFICAVLTLHESDLPFFKVLFNRKDIILHSSTFAPKFIDFLKKNKEYLLQTKECVSVLNYFLKGDMEFDFQQVLDVVTSLTNQQTIEEFLHLIFTTSRVKMSRSSFFQLIEFHPNFLPHLIIYCINVNFCEVFIRAILAGIKLENFLKLFLSLFVLPKRLKPLLVWKFTSHAKNKCRKEEVNSYMKQLNQQPTVPRLEELARDSVRTLLRNNCRNSRQCLQALNSLPVSSEIKDIIRCKKPLYPLD